MSEAYLGEIRIFAGPYAPVGWQLCDGTLLSVNDNAALFSLLNTTYGGNGVSTFAVPDLRGRAPIHQGAGLGLTNRVLAQQPGAEEIALATSELPSHGHALQATSTPGSSSTPGPTLLLGNTTGMRPGGTGNFLNIYQTQTTATAVASTVQLNGATIGNNNPAGASHDNMMASLALTYIICLAGTYPQQN